MTGKEYSGDAKELAGCPQAATKGREGYLSGWGDPSEKCAV